MVVTMNIHEVTKVTVSDKVINPPHGPVNTQEYTFCFQDYKGHEQSIVVTAFMKTEEPSKRKGIKWLMRK